MANIIVKSYSGYNRALGKHITSKKDYFETMKKMGCAPSDKVTVGSKDLKPYEPSKWAREMVSDIKSRNGKKPGGKFYDELAKKGVTKESYEKAMNKAKETVHATL